MLRFLGTLVILFVLWVIISHPADAGDTVSGVLELTEGIAESILRFLREATG